MLQEKSLLLVRLMVGAVFFTEGLQKFIFAARAIDKFTSIGFPAPELMVYMVGAFEVGCGLMILVGYRVRASSIPILVIMCVAIVSTKIPQLGEKGLWTTLHAVRLDYSMLLGALILFASGKDQVPFIDANSKNRLDGESAAQGS